MRIFDRRRKSLYGACLFMASFAIVWVFLTAAIADTLPDKPLTQGDLVKAQWWVVGGLLGLVLIIGQGFIIYVVSGVKSNVRKLFDLHEHVLTVSIHDKLDHSQLCAVCRKPRKF